MDWVTVWIRGCTVAGEPLGRDLDHRIPGAVAIALNLKEGDVIDNIDTCARIINLMAAIVDRLDEQRA